jgi:glucan phosphoethanolaminetransferase (alkaline phosphatase superfamily)
MSNNEFNNIEEYREKIKIDKMDWILTFLGILITVIIMLTFIYRIDFIVQYFFSVLYIAVAVVITLSFLREQTKMIKALDEKHKKEGN